MGKKKTGAKAAEAKAKKDARKQEQLKKQAQLDTLRAARGIDNPIASIPAPFIHYKRNGVDAAVEYYNAKTLTQPDREALHSILDENMAPIYGQKEWDEEAAADKQKELKDEDCRLLVIRNTLPASPGDAPDSPVASPASSPANSPEKEAQDARESRLHDLATHKTKPGPAEGPREGILGFMHFR